jgi:uncharacterized protein (DUF433 family)
VVSSIEHRRLEQQIFFCWVLKMRRVIVKDPDILGGEPVFRGTRVPFKVLTDYLEGGDTLDQFLEQYPSVSRELAIAAIEEARFSRPAV